MNRLAVGSFVLLFTALGGLNAWVRLRSEVGETENPGLAVVAGSPKHIVTREMAEASRAMAWGPAPPFEAEATDGRSYTLVGPCRRDPLVLTFIKDGCPCGEAAQPFFNRLQAAYPEAQFLGVIDAETDKATRWADKFRVAYPLLLDPACRIVRDYQVENSASVVLVDAQGRIRKHWPGYSSGILRELGATLAELTGTVECPIDVADAPNEEYSGCPFAL